MKAKKQKSEWFDNDEFWKDVYPQMFTEDRLSASGFLDIKIFGNLDGDDYGPGGQRLIAVARKP